VNWQDHLLDTLRRLQPPTVCSLDPVAHELASRLIAPQQLHPYQAESATRCELALGIDALSGLDSRQGVQLLAQVRTYAAPALLIAALPGCPLDAEAFRALGFVASFNDSVENVTIYHYDIATYKPVPDWLNAKYWAHPERWEP
jgi:hypothetical protein